MYFIFLQLYISLTESFFCYPRTAIPIEKKSENFAMRHSKISNLLDDFHDNFLEISGSFPPYEVSDVARLYRLNSFFKLIWEGAVDKWLGIEIFGEKYDFSNFCMNMKNFEISITTDWCISAIGYSESKSIENVISSLKDALNFVAASPSNRAESLGVSSANNTNSLGEQSWWFLALKEKPWNRISVCRYGQSEDHPRLCAIDSAFLLNRGTWLDRGGGRLGSRIGKGGWEEGIQKSCVSLREILYDLERAGGTVLRKNLEISNPISDPTQNCLFNRGEYSPEILSFDPTKENCLAIKSRSSLNSTKLIIAHFNPILPPDFNFVPIFSNQSNWIHQQCSLGGVAAMVNNFVFLRIIEHHIAVFVRADLAFPVFSNFGSGPDRLFADWLVEWHLSPLVSTALGGLSMHACVPSDILANPGGERSVRKKILCDYFSRNSVEIETVEGIAADTCVEQKEDSERLLGSGNTELNKLTISEQCAFENKRGWGNDHLSSHTDAKDKLTCAQHCAREVSCYFWTFDGVGVYGGLGCWIWLKGYPEIVTKESGWISGNWTCAISRSVNIRMNDVLIANKSIEFTELEWWSHQQVERVPGVGYLLDKFNRGRCTDAGICECFPPWRGALCNLSEPGIFSRNFTAVLHYLTSDSDSDIADISVSLPILWKNWNKKFDYPVVVFHDGLSGVNRKKITSASSNRIWFAYVENFATVPAWITESKKYSNVMQNIRWGVGYRGMCKFRSGTMFLQPVLRSVDYLMTLDTDGYLPDSIDFDPIDEMYQGGYVYTYSHILDDQPAAVEHFWEHTRMFMRDRQIDVDSTPLLRQFIHEEKWNMKLYMNDIEVMKIDWFRGQPYQDYFNYLDSQGGWWLYRWGDHAVRTMAVSMWLEESKLKRMIIPYGHQGYCSCGQSEKVCVKESLVYTCVSI